MSSDARQLAERLNAATVHLMRALRQEGDARELAAEHRTALAAVVFAGPMPIGALARREQVGASAMTKTVGILESRGLVVRRRDRDDARVIRVEATAKGRANVERRRDEQVVRIGAALARLERADRARIEDAIEALERLVGDLERARMEA